MLLCDHTYYIMFMFDAMSERKTEKQKIWWLRGAVFCVPRL